MTHIAVTFANKNVVYVCARRHRYVVLFGFKFQFYLSTALWNQQQTKKIFLVVHILILENRQKEI